MFDEPASSCLIQRHVLFGPSELRILDLFEILFDPGQLSKDRVLFRIDTVEAEVGYRNSELELYLCL